MGDDKSQKRYLLDTVSTSAAYILSREASYGLWSMHNLSLASIPSEKDVLAFCSACSCFCTPQQSEVDVDDESPSKNELFNIKG